MEIVRQKYFSRNLGATPNSIELKQIHCMIHCMQKSYSTSSSLTWNLNLPNRWLDQALIHDRPVFSPFSRFLSIFSKFCQRLPLKCCIMYLFLFLITNYFVYQMEGIGIGYSNTHSSFQKESTISSCFEFYLRQKKDQMLLHQ